jgi:hypothetical protein
MKTIAILGMAGALAFASGAAFAEPAKDVSGKKHPNLSAAQKLSIEAYNKIIAAQNANEFDMEGHAAKAKDLLDQVNSELKQAAEAANKAK